MSVFVSSIFVFVSFTKNNNRMSILNFKIERIDFSKTTLNEIIVLKENDFNASLIMRMEHYQVSANMIKENPIFGIGPGRWNSYKVDYASTNRQIMDSHNDFLASTSQFGILGGTALCLMLYLTTFVNYRAKRKECENDYTPLNYLFIISLVMAIAGISNTGIFKYPIFGFLMFITVYSIFNRDLL